MGRNLHGKGFDGNREGGVFYGGMDRGVFGWLDGSFSECAAGLWSGWVIGWLDTWMGRWVSGWRDGWVYGWISGCMNDGCRI